MTTQKLAIFDWNGTLIADTKPAWIASNACLEFYGRGPITFAEQLDTFDFPIIHFYKRNGCDIDRVLATKDEANVIFHAHYDREAAKARTRRGTRQLLDWLKQQDITCIILSNYIVPKIEHHTHRLKIRDYFAHISAHTCNGTTILNTTNKKERLAEFMLKRGYQPANAFIIGDSMEEPEIGRNLNITSIGITGGCISEKRLRHARPDHLIRALPEVIPLLQKKWSLPF